MDETIYRQRVHSYVTSMTFFKSLYLDGTLTDSMYELIEARLAFKYGLPVRSVFRDEFKLKW